MGESNNEIKKFVDGIVNQRVNMLNVRLPPIVNPMISNTGLTAVPLITMIGSPLMIKSATGVSTGVEALVNNSGFYFTPVARLFNQINHPN